MKQEQIMQIQMMEQEVNQLNQQLQLIEQNIKEMGELSESLEEIGNEKNKDILANLGKRIFIPVEIKDRKLIVEVGKGNFVKKSVSETKEVIERESKKLMEGRAQIMERLTSLQMEMNNLFMDMQKEQVEASNNRKDSIEDLADGK